MTINEAKALEEEIDRRIEKAKADIVEDVLDTIAWALKRGHGLEGFDPNEAVEAIYESIDQRREER